VCSAVVEVRLDSLVLRLDANVAKIKTKNTPADTATAALSIPIRRNLASKELLEKVTMKKGVTGYIRSPSERTQLGWNVIRTSTGTLTPFEF
jgi:hypothetical protein